MSYIRNGTNPEQLYIWDDGVMINIQWKILEKQQNVVVEREHFFQLIEEYSKYNYNDTIINVDEINFIPAVYLKCKLQFTTYDDLSLELWQVTWDSVVNEYRRKKFWRSRWKRFKFFIDKINW